MAGQILRSDINFKTSLGLWIVFSCCPLFTDYLWIASAGSLSSWPLGIVMSPEDQIKDLFSTLSPAAGDLIWLRGFRYFYTPKTLRYEYTYVICPLISAVVHPAIYLKLPLEWPIGIPNLVCPTPKALSPFALGVSGNSIITGAQACSHAVILGFPLLDPANCQHILVTSGR